MTTTATDDVTTEIIAAEDAHVAHNYHPLPVVIARGEGAWVTDIEGKRYLDLLGGIAVNSLGHAHPAVVSWSVRAMCVMPRAAHSATSSSGGSAPSEAVECMCKSTG